MATPGCPTYKYQMTRESKSYQVLEYLHQAGVTDAMLDNGYHQIDYLKPGEWGQVKGAKDCFIDERELKEFLSDNWRKYKPQLKELVKETEGLPWDKDDALFAKKEPQQGLFLDRAKEAAKIVEADLLKMGVLPQSEEWQTTMAEGIYLWHEFPSKRRWEKLAAPQKKEVLAALKQLNEPRFSGLKKFLVQNGGSGNFGSTTLLNTTRYKANSFQFAPDYGNITLFFLYAAYEAAGLNPTFVELEDIWPQQFKCGMPMFVRHGVGFDLSSGWRVFDPAKHIYNAEEGVFYPISLRQVLSVREASQGMVAGLVSKSASQMASQEGSYSTDGAGAALTYLITATMGPDGAPPGSSEDKEARLKALLNSNTNSFPPLLAGFVALGKKSGSSCVEMPKSFEEFERAGTSKPYALYFRALSCMQRQNLSEVVPFARELLKYDPLCYTAHSLLAKAGTDKAASLSNAEIESHFAKAYEALSEDNERRATINMEWGLFELTRGKKALAIQKLIAANNFRGADEDDLCQAAFHLAHATAGKKSSTEAASWMEKANLHALAYLGKGVSDSESMDIYKFLKRENAARPLAAWIGGDDKLSLSVFKLISSVGNNLAFYGKFSEAVEAYEIAKSIALRNADRIVLLTALHRVLVKKGDIAGAEKILDELRGLAYSDK